MKAVVFIPDCCSRARLAADAAKLSMSVRAVLDRYCCGEIDASTAIKEIVQLCRKADGRKALLGWTLMVQDCDWVEVEEVVRRVGGDIVYR
jgi:hypothetical protein